jgi:hypothetical protein
MEDVKGKDGGDVAKIAGPAALSVASWPHSGALGEVGGRQTTPLFPLIHLNSSSLPPVRIESLST